MAKQTQHDLFNKQKEQVLSEVKRTNSVDETIMAIDKAVNIPEQEDNSKTIAESAGIEDIKLNVSLDGLRAKEVRTVHKNFLISKRISDKLEAVAKAKGVSQNELVNEIFRNVFD